MKNSQTEFVLPLLIIIALALVVTGITLGFLYSRLPSNNPQKSQVGCESVGGDWNAVAQECLVSYKKTGELCTEEQKINLISSPLENMAGTCYPDELITGCVEQVLMGTISKESMCLD